MTFILLVFAVDTSFTCRLWVRPLVTREHPALDQLDWLCAGHVIIFFLGKIRILAFQSVYICKRLVISMVRIAAHHEPVRDHARQLLAGNELAEVHWSPD